MFESQCGRLRCRKLESIGSTIPESMIILLLLLSFSQHATTAPASTTSSKHNVLHIISDDLRPDLGCYGLPLRHTPNIDEIANSGTVFTRAYAQQAVCGPSRNSFLSGRRPDLSRSWNFINHFRQDHPTDWTSLPGLFVKDPDFVSLGAGKVFHPKLPPAYDGNSSWSAPALPYKNPCWNTADDPAAPFQDGGLPCFFCKIDIESRLFPNKFNTTVANEFCTTDAYEDTLSIWNGIQQLKQVPNDKFFYLAVGLHKPHLPWQATQEDFDKHPLANVQVAKHQFPPRDVPGVALQFTEHMIHPSPYDPIYNTSAQLARRAYRATITGMDRKLKTLLDALKDSGRYNNTAIVFHSDHGWHLGELGEWRKFTNFEVVSCGLVQVVVALIHFCVC
jgi:iduronate 2-sulfatase